MIDTTREQQPYARFLAWLFVTWSTVCADAFLGWGVGTNNILVGAVIVPVAIAWAAGLAAAVAARVRIAEAEDYGERVQREADAAIAAHFEEANDA